MPKTKGRKGKPKPKRIQRQHSGHSKLLEMAIGAARKQGLFLLVEQAGNGKPEVWLLYDAKASGKHVASFWPGTRSLSLGGRVEPIASVFEALRKIEKATAKP